MNLGGKSSNDLLFANFNQDFSCISVGTKRGFKIYNCDPFGKCYSKYDGGRRIVEMLFCTSLVALVGGGEQPAFSPRRLQICNTKRQSTICELTFPTTVLAVKLNRRRLIAVLENQIYVYDISNMKLVHTIETAFNPSAVCALSPSSDECYLAYPTAPPSAPIHTPTSPTSPHSTSSGDILIFDALSLNPLTIIQAHKNPVSCLAFSSNGSMLATAGEKGTLVRVFSVPDGTKLFQFRRGTYPARIFSLNFNLANTLLACSSETETVHIFKLSHQHPQSSQSQSQQSGAVSGSAVSSPIDFAPQRTGSSSSLTPPIMSSSPTATTSVPPSTTSGSISSATSTLLKSTTGAIGSLLARRGSINQYLPEFVNEMLEPARDFAFLKLPCGTGVQSLVALSNSGPQVMVVTSQGNFYQYNIDLENGGECTLMKQYSLLDGDDESEQSNT